ncbi:MAG: ribbon-helix-helix domain-containing protein [Bacteroidia bacterium]|nr:ribbon-helix-helix domain-containing protein [Bacteroidia bacterium]
MEKKERKNYNTKLDVGLIKKLKFLSVETDTRQNDLIEEAIQDLLKKYEKKPKK